MWIADQWRDYELLDCGNGEKLERWDTQYLVRPDPQAIWATPRRNPAWKRANARYLRSQSGGGHWEKKALPESWKIRYAGADLPGKAHELQAHGTVPGAGGELGLRHGEDPLRRPAHPGAEPVCLHRRGHAWPAPRRGPASAMWTRPSGMVAWARENAKLSGLERPPSAGSWTTAPSLWSGRSAGARPTTPSSWIRPPTAVAPAARCGSWRTTSTTS